MMLTKDRWSEGHEVTERREAISRTITDIDTAVVRTNLQLINRRTRN